MHVCVHTLNIYVYDPQIRQPTVTSTYYYTDGMLEVCNVHIYQFFYCYGFELC